MNQKLLISAGIIILLVGGFAYYNFGSQPALDSLPKTSPLNTSITPGTSGEPSTSKPPSTPAKGTAGTTLAPNKPSTTGGRVIFTITDKSAPLSGIKSVLISIDKLWVNHEKLGWQEVKFGGPMVFDLLDLRQKGTLKLLYDTKLSLGNYSEVQIKVGSVVVIPIVGNTKTAKLLSTDIKFGGRFSVKSNEASVVVYDFILDKALHLTTTNDYIFAPFIEFRTTINPIIEITSSQEVKSAGGTIGYSTSIGIDENGILKQNYTINPNQEITILSNGTLKLLNQGELDSGFTISATQAITLAQNAGNVTTAKSIKILKEGENTYWIISGFKASTFVTVKVNTKTGVVVN